jgi:hypothetical protein
MYRGRSCGVARGRETEVVGKDANGGARGKSLDHSRVKKIGRAYRHSALVIVQFISVASTEHETIVELVDCGSRCKHPVFCRRLAKCA